MRRYLNTLARYLKGLHRSSRRDTRVACIIFPGLARSRHVTFGNRTLSFHPRRGASYATETALLILHSSPAGAAV